MRAPVYRHVEGESTIGGVSLHGFIGLLGVALAAIQFLPFVPSVLAVGGAYAVLRIASTGKPPLHWQHLLVFHCRRWAAGGRLLAAARCKSPRFPFGRYLSRDIAR
jgi:hypothetical protein